MNPAVQKDTAPLPDEQVPIRSSFLARRMLLAKLPVPQTQQDIECYVHRLHSEPAV